MNKFYCRRVGSPARYLGFHHFDAWNSPDVVRVHCEEWGEGDPPTEYWGWVRLPRQPHPGGDPIRMIQPSYALLSMCFPDMDYEIRVGRGVPVRVTVRVAVEG
jgi:hypothetical protein